MHAALNQYLSENPLASAADLSEFLTRYQNVTVWVLYDQPTNIARTGHAALLITAEEDEKQIPIYYASPYHGVLPNDIRAAGWAERFKTLYPLVVVDDYFSDRMMRGRSWKVLTDARQAAAALKEQRKPTTSGKQIRSWMENATVPHLLNTLPSNPKKRQCYFEKGAYRYAYQLPASINTAAVVLEFERIKRDGEWAVFAAVVNTLGLGSDAYNCCSAIDAALQKGKVHGVRASGIDNSSRWLLGLRLAYFMWLFSGVAGNTQFLTMTVLPAIYMITNSFINAMTYVFANDLNCTPFGKLAGMKLYFVCAFFGLLNILSSPFTANAAYLFTSPVGLGQKVKRTYGGTHFNAGFLDLPQLPDQEDAKGMTLST